MSCCSARPRASFLRRPEYHEADGGVALNPAALPRRESVAWILNLLRLTAGRAPAFACFGLHEWAMVYRQNARRGAAQRLAAALPARRSWRASSRPQPVRCSHFDAFRFFTAPAQPLNKLAPTRATVPEFEQPGCLHANMDLYKWAFKLAPFTPAGLTADCFAFARDIREIDMRASPYDLQKLGYAPLRIETPEGRAEYEAHQRDFAARSLPLRARLIALCERLLAG